MLLGKTFCFGKLFFICLISPGVTLEAASRTARIKDEDLLRNPTF